MGEFLLKKSKWKESKGKGLTVAAVVMAAILLFSCAVLLLQRGYGKKQTAEKKEEAYQSLSAPDRETADLYAELYEIEREEVAKLQGKTKDWEKTGKELEQAFFTIPENKKYQMEKEGYALADLQEAERLSVKTGRKAMELAKAKGKASENKSWSEVVKDSEILTTEEQLGLSKQQIKRLKEKSLDQEERIDVAVLLLNGSYTFEEVMEALDDGKTVEELKKQESK